MIMKKSSYLHNNSKIISQDNNNNSSQLKKLKRVFLLFNKRMLIHRTEIASQLSQQRNYSIIKTNIRIASHSLTMEMKI